MTLRTKGALALAALTLVACIKTGPLLPGPPDPTADPPPTEPPPPEAAPLDTTVTFGGRTIDIGPHIAGFPYRGFKVEPDLGMLFYRHIAESGQTLHVLPLDGDLDLATGRQITDIDWTTRNLRRWKALPDENALLALADEDNAETYDLYKIHLDDGRIEKLTDVPYIYGFGLDLPRDRVGFIARYPRDDGTETYTSCLQLMPLAGGEATKAICDDDAMMFSWGAVRFSADGDTVWINGKADNDRARTNLLRVDLTTDPPTLQRVTVEATRSGLWMLEHWLDDDTFAFVSNESGFTNLWAGTASTDAVRQLTDFSEELDDAAVLHLGEVVRVLGVIRRPSESEIVLLDPDGTVLAREVIEANLYSFGESDESVWYYATSRFARTDMFRVTATADAFERTPFIGLPPDLEAKLQHCDVERVTIPTFDTTDDGTQRTLHAYLSIPRMPPAPGERRLAGIVAFYGGSNSWDTHSQILCQAGVTALSPSVRGSWGFGQDFAALNDGDLGGDEIVDLHQVAQWLVDEHGFEPRDLGVYGGSHGGYATMRALTFPPETNGRDSSFDWGWGVSFFGFSDIKTFWETCNIPDWVLLEAGDPATEPDKIRDRSPLHHVDKLDAPILLLHGENDQRVPVQESRQFKAACDEADKACTYVEFAGQGHGLKGLRNQVEVYRLLFEFLESLPVAVPPE